MSGDYDDDVCRGALRLVHELCFAPRSRPPHARCLEFTDLLRHRGHPRPADTEVSVSLLSVIVTFCGLVLLGVSPLPPVPEEPPPSHLGQIQPELYDSADSHLGSCVAAGPGGVSGSPGGVPGSPCGRLGVSVRYCYGSQQLQVRVLRARDLPAKDSNGFSDPYVKIYLLPDRKKKFQTKVLRRTLNPEWDETFSFGVPFAELPARRLHFSVYDFDRFSRHDLIGQVVMDNLLEVAEARPEVPIWRDIQEGTGEKADLGEVNFSLCYLPTAGRLTVTVIRASNLRAMDLTGYSGVYRCYSIGHNEVIGLCRVGSDADGPGREHWAQMLANPRKPIEHWHTLVEEKALSKAAPRDKPALGEPLGPH
ncbi:PREDICTED: synaptotagmin-3-like [Sturnus vulgaris]|uniref:synaptotagmin-3-like n=1 Tax=Sturnus vulgaris TaxID=9172 RepID=UPI00071A9656|nr:PREDICTED: synaptotagmin-3-like [Sturnus vulgaris]